jgi:hypothetical protein
VADKLPAERVLAYAVDHGAVIARLDHTGLHWVATMPAARQLAWTADGKTVVGLDGGTSVGSDIHLWTSTDAGAAVTSIVPADDGPMPDPTLPGAQLGTAGGAVWLRRCNDKEATVVKHGIVGCYDWMYRQLAPPAKGEVEKPPKGFALVTDEPVLAKVAAPAGYKVEGIKFTVPTTQIPNGTLHHKGWKCTGPNGSSQYPDDSWGDFDEYTGKSVTWIQQDPPLYRATARSVSLAGEKADVSAVFVACEAKPLDAYLDFGGGVWAAYGDIAPDTQAWTIRLGTTPIAHIAGSDLAAAPAP